MYQVGDRVTIKCLSEFEEYDDYGTAGFVTPGKLFLHKNAILAHGGSEATIDAVISNLWDSAVYRINIDCGVWLWDDYCFKECEDCDLSGVEDLI